MEEARRVSVIIPHLNQGRLLGLCLDSIEPQARAFDGEVEVFVCDNGSMELPEATVARYPRARLLSVATPGPGPARNGGVAESTGDILAFIDADCTAHPNWLNAIVQAFEQSGGLVIGGDVRVPYKDPSRPTFLEPYEAVFAYRNKEYIASGYSGTGILAMRREAFDRVGPFAGIGVAEDQDWGLRARAMGIETRYVPEMIIYHPAREKFSELTRKWDRHIEHDFALREGLSGRLAFAAKALAVVVSPVAEIPRIVRSDRISGLKERAMAFACLCCIRTYRAARMLARTLGTARAGARSWNRG